MKETKEKTEDWEKDLLELCFELRDRTYGSHYRVLVKFIRQLLKSQKQELLGKIKLKMKRYTNFKTAEGEDNMFRKEGYNSAVEDLEELKKKLWK